MNFLYNVIGTPLGWIMWFLYQAVKNYGVALFLFTLATRLALFPMSLKQQKSTAKMSVIQPKIQEIQKMYANNKEKQQEEMMKLYQQEGYNPMSGCLPLLIQMPILFGLIDVIYRPIKHILHIPAEIITTIEETVVSLGLMPENMLGRLNSGQIIAAQAIGADPSPFLAAGVSQDVIDKINTLDLNFLGINLGLTPSWDMFGAVLQGQFNPLILIPVLSGLSALAMSLISMRTMGASAGGQNPAGGTMKGMMLIMPIFSFTIAVSVPAGVGVYWFYSNLLAIVQSLILHKYHNPKEMAEKARAEAEERQAREREERIEAKKKAREEALARGEKPEDEKVLSQKELNRRKLAEARRRDAEKYGEEYVDVTDEDLR